MLQGYVLLDRYTFDLDLGASIQETPGEVRDVHPASLPVVVTYLLDSCDLFVG